MEKKVVDALKLELYEHNIRGWYKTVKLVNVPGKIGFRGDSDIKVGGK